MEEILDQSLDLMRTSIEEAEAVGIDTIKARCGRGNQVDELFTGVFVLRSQLRVVRVALGEAVDILSCPTIHSLYSRAVHDTLCTDLATATADGFLLFLLISLSSMMLITLRAAWRHN